MMSSAPWVLAALLAAAVPAAAATLTATRPLDGYACMKLNLSPAAMLDPATPDVPILLEPRPDAPRGTIAAALVLVREPMVVRNGYAEVMQLTGTPGWIKANMVVPLPADVLCRPSVMSNGRPGFG